MTIWYIRGLPDPGGYFQAGPQQSSSVSDDDSGGAATSFAGARAHRTSKVDAAIDHLMIHGATRKDIALSAGGVNWNQRRGDRPPALK